MAPLPREIMIAGMCAIIGFVHSSRDTVKAQTSHSNSMQFLDCQAKYREFFRNFIVPLAYVADRKFNCSSPPSADSGAPYRHIFSQQMTMAFWMPDGGGVRTNPSHLVNLPQVDPRTGLSLRTVLRPFEKGRNSADRSAYVVVIGAFCPLSFVERKSSSDWPIFKHTLGLTGYGYGALGMFSCSINSPGASWIQVDHAEKNASPMYCRENVRHCFGWINLKNYPAKALTFIPSDVVPEVPGIKAKLDALLNRWAEAP